MLAEEDIKCKNCGHTGSMHSDGVNYTHTGECYANVGRGICKCKKFIKEQSAQKKEAGE